MTPPAMCPLPLPCSYDVPLVADIHFQPQVAMMVADAFEKIRINPGNFVDGRKSFEVGVGKGYRPVCSTVPDAC
jgi:4-hydroxy-3-methylbut-2-en-1-yl diphosphate synthase IspG/GcpE